MNASTNITRPHRAAVLALLLPLMLFLSMLVPGTAHAAGYVASTYDGDEAYAYSHGVSVRAVPSGSYPSVKYSLVVTRSGKTKTVAKDVSPTFITNGKYLYYAKRGKQVASAVPEWNHRKAVIYRLNIKTNAKKRMASGVQIVPRDISGKYLYYTKTKSAASDPSHLYALNTKTCKKKSMGKDVSYFGKTSKNVVCTAFSNTGYSSLYSFAKNGSKKKTITKHLVSGAVSIRGGKVYYIEYGNSDGDMKFRAVRCSPNGNSKKALTGWSYGQSACQSLRATYID